MATANKGVPSKKPMRFGLAHIIIAIIIIVIIYFALTSFVFNSIHQLNVQESFTLNKNNTIFYSFPDNSTTYAIFLKNVSSSSATFYVSGLPILTKPVVVVTLLAGGSANVSSKAGSVADIHLSLSSSTGSQATFSMTPLLQGLNIRVNGNLYVLNPSSLSGNVSVTTIATTISTTTVGSTSTLTTIINVTPNHQVLSGVNATPIGKLMSKYKALYMKDTQCTPSVYNSTYLSQFGSLPPAPSSYVNVSELTPTNLDMSVSNVATNIYNITYSSVSPSSLTTGAALVVEYSLASNSIIAQKFKGIFLGQNYTQLNSSYNFQGGFNNNCGAYIA